MVNLMSRFLRGQCWRHAEPIFDRDATGAIFRCPHCLAAWPRPHRREIAAGGVAAVSAVPVSPVPGSPAPGSMLSGPRSKRRVPRRMVASARA